MSNEIKNNAWLKYEWCRKQRKFLICVKGTRIIYQWERLKENVYMKLLGLAEEKGYRNLADIIKNNEEIKGRG